MAKYIDAEALRRYLEVVKTYDVQEEQHGEWKAYDDILYICSKCHDCYVNEKWVKSKWKYCPNCGAKMDGGNGN